MGREAVKNCSTSLLAHGFIQKNPTGPDKSLIGSAPRCVHSLTHTYTLALTQTHTHTLTFQNSVLKVIFLWGTFQMFGQALPGGTFGETSLRQELDPARLLWGSVSLPGPSSP